MNRNTLIALVAGLVVGLLIGYQVGSSGREEARPAASFGPPPGSPSPFGGGAAPGGAAPLPGGGGPMLGGPAPSPDAHLETERRIAVGQQIVARDPKNVQAWIQLGNDYFDTHRPQQSIDAYAKALAMEPNNPDVLTDQGVMYREVRQFDKALANFRKANQVKPDHVQSLFNIGVVYQHDLKDSAKALQAWEKVVQVAPASPQAADARRAIDELKAGRK